MTAAAFNLSQRLPGKRAFITGAASGLGLACAEVLAREGWKLVLVDQDGPRLDLVAQSLTRDGAHAIAAPCDVRDEARLREIVGMIVDAGGGIDLAIHSAGVAVAGSFVRLPADDWRWVVDVNLHGVANCCRVLVPHMARNPKGGIIINVASAAGFVAGAKMSAYSASKAAVIALSETLMQELAPYDVQVVAAMPGFFRTRLIEGARGTPESLAAAGRLVDESGVEAAEVAEALLYAAARGRTHFVYPSRYSWLWRLKRLAPARFWRWLPRLAGRPRPQRS